MTNFEYKGDIYNHVYNDVHRSIEEDNLYWKGRHATARRRKDVMERMLAELEDVYRKAEAYNRLTDREVLE